MVWKFSRLWDNEKWWEPAYVTVDDQGVIKGLSQETPVNVDEEVAGWAVPGFQNAHSHAFQYLMAGQTEHRPTGQSFDYFWSWRSKMYELALRLNPEEMEEAAFRLYRDMLRKGYTWVAEFHYLHHDPKGNKYPEVAEMSRRLLRAAERSGIGITLVPIFYQQGGFNQGPSPQQRRFISKTYEDYLDLFSECSKLCTGPRQKIALGIHSLRAASAEAIKELVDSAPKNVTWHIHIAEQQKEVEEALQHLGKRPVQWLLDQLPVDQNWHLVHSTHVTPSEIHEMVQRKLSVVLCPSTEGNLGDGRFPLLEYWKQGGRWSIGSDSHISLNPLEELRWLDYVQRLEHQQRNILCLEGGHNSGTLAIQESWKSGRAAMGFKGVQRLGPGDFLDLVVLRDEQALMQQSAPDHWLSTLIYCCDPSDFKGTITAGRWVI